MEELNTKDKIIQILQSTNRKGMDTLIEWLEKSDFFTAPASTKYHGCFEGGLAQHSFNVLDIMNKRVAQYKLDIKKESLAIACLLHDVCKIGLYGKTNGCYMYNRAIATKGHSKFSIYRIKEFIELEHIEELMIRYHMGFFGTEVIPYSKEYSSREYMDITNKHPILMLMHHVDNEESKFMADEKGD